MRDKRMKFNLTMLGAIIQFEFLYHQGMINECLEEIQAVPDAKIPDDMPAAIRDYKNYRYFGKPKPAWLA